MLCKNCGYELQQKENKLICPNCGAEVDLTAPEKTVPEQTSETPQPASEPASEYITPRGFSSKKNIIIIVIAAILALGICAGIAAFAVTNSPTFKASQGIKIAEQFLSDQDYEQAIIEYEKVLEIEPMNVDAYLGLADAYVKNGNLDMAIEILRKGYEQTNDSRIKQRLDSLTNPPQSYSSSSSSSVPVSSSSAPVSSSSSSAESSSSNIESSSSNLESNYSSSSSVLSSSFSSHSQSSSSSFASSSSSSSKFVGSSKSSSSSSKSISSSSSAPVIAESTEYLVIEDNILVGVTEKGLMATEIVIPYGVTRINARAFGAHANVESISIPETVTSIGKNAFAGCNKLKNVSIPNNVTTIGDGAFRECESLTNISIPDKVTEIGEMTFYNCYALKSITFGKNLTKIGSEAFVNCNFTSLSLPNSVTEIGSMAFQNCPLTDVYIPESIKSVYGAFGGSRNISIKYKGNTYDCDHLTDFYEAVHNNSSGTSENIQSEIFIIENNVVMGLTSAGEVLNELVIPKGVTEIGAYAFDGDTFAKISIPDSVTKIDECAFQNCYNLESIIIPKNVKKISASAFENCSNLSSVTFNDGLTSIDALAFASCWSLANVTIPDSVIEIKDTAFENCWGTVFTYKGKTYTNTDIEALYSDINGN